MIAWKELTLRITDLTHCMMKCQWSVTKPTNLLIGPGARGAVAAYWSQAPQRRHSTKCIPYLQLTFLAVSVKCEFGLDHLLVHEKDLHDHYQTVDHISLETCLTWMLVDAIGEIWAYLPWIFLIWLYWLCSNSDQDVWTLLTSRDVLQWHQIKPNNLVDWTNFVWLAYCISTHGSYKKNDVESLKSRQLH